MENHVFGSSKPDNILNNVVRVGRPVGGPPAACCDNGTCFLRIVAFTLLLVGATYSYFSTAGCDFGSYPLGSIQTGHKRSTSTTCGAGYEAFLVLWIIALIVCLWPCSPPSGGHYQPLLDEEGTEEIPTYTDEEMPIADATPI